MIYDSDKSSSSQSSDSETEPLEQGQKQMRKNAKRIKNAIAYRFCQQKQEQKFKLIFQTWRDDCLVTYRSSILMADRHYQNTLYSKGFDGIIEYAMTSISFKEKIVMFYYRFFMSKFFQALKDERRLPLKKSKNDLEKINDKIMQVNQSISSIYQQKGKGTIFRNYFDESEAKIAKEKNQESIQKQNNIKARQYSCRSLKQIFQKQKMRNLDLAFKSIRLYLSKPKIKRDMSPQQNYELQQQSRQQNIMNQSNQKQFRRSHATHTIHQNRQTNSMINSRRSMMTQPSCYSGLNQNKSRRKLAPIVEQIELVPFIKKPQVKVISKERQRQKSPSPLVEQRKPINQSKEIAQNRQKEQQQLLNMAKKQQQQRRKLQQQNLKRIQQRKDRIYSILTKAKLMELCLINDMPIEEQGILRNYRQLSIQTLLKIKSI